MQTVSFAGSNYAIPTVRGDTPWSGLSDFVIACAAKAINIGGGNFTLLADLNFGASFGLVSTYFKSRSSNVASAGQLRLASTDTVKWRNNANGADIALDKDTSDSLRWNATKLLLSGAVVNADINASAAIAYSKLALTDSIVNADISASAAIAYSKLTLTGSIVNADISASAAIAYSKLALTGAILNADIAAGAAIARNKLAALTASRVVVTDGSGFDTVATTTATEIGYVNGVTSAIQTQIDGKRATFSNGQLPGTATNDSASAGNVGEAVRSNVLSASAVSLDVASTFVNITSISLTAGDWDVSGIVEINLNAATGLSVGFMAISTDSGNTTTDHVVGDNQINAVNALPTANGPAWISLPTYRLSLSGTTTVYLKAATSGSSGTPKAYGRISARRMR